MSLSISLPNRGLQLESYAKTTSNFFELDGPCQANNVDSLTGPLPFSSSKSPSDCSSGNAHCDSATTVASSLSPYSDFFGDSMPSSAASVDSSPYSDFFGASVPSTPADTVFAPLDLEEDAFTVPCSVDSTDSSPYSQFFDSHDSHGYPMKNKDEDNVMVQQLDLQLFPEQQIKCESAPRMPQFCQDVNQRLSENLLTPQAQPYAMDIDDFELNSSTQSNLDLFTQPQQLNLFAAQQQQEQKQQQFQPQTLLQRRLRRRKQQQPIQMVENATILERRQSVPQSSALPIPIPEPSGHFATLATEIDTVMSQSAKTTPTSRKRKRDQKSKTKPKPKRKRPYKPAPPQKKIKQRQTRAETRALLSQLEGMIDMSAVRAQGVRVSTCDIVDRACAVAAEYRQLEEKLTRMCMQKMTAAAASSLPPFGGHTALCSETFSHTSVPRCMATMNGNIISANGAFQQSMGLNAASDLSKVDISSLFGSTWGQFSLHAPTQTTLQLLSDSYTACLWLSHDGVTEVVNVLLLKQS